MQPAKRIVEVIKSDPVDQLARRVTAPGIHYEPSAPPEFLAMIRHSKTPHRLRRDTWRGLKFGRFTVMGEIWQTPRRNLETKFSCRCLCGAYETRSWRAINNPANASDACYFCKPKRLAVIQPKGGMRGEFESWLAASHPTWSLEPFPGGYHFPATQDAWVVWQAAWSSARNRAALLGAGT